VLPNRAAIKMEVPLPQITAEGSRLDARAAA
jgi:hypothetical protein